MKSGLAEGGPLGFSDAAKRASDQMLVHLSAGEHTIGRWIAIRLSDGGSDGVAYELLAEAIRFQLHPTQCMYLQIAAGGIPPKEADVMLGYYRRAYDNGHRPDDLWAAALAKEGIR